MATVYWVWRGSQRWFTADDWYVLMYRDLGRGDLTTGLQHQQDGHQPVCAHGRIVAPQTGQDVTGFAGRLRV